MNPNEPATGRPSPFSLFPSPSASSLLRFGDNGDFFALLGFSSPGGRTALMKFASNRTVAAVSAAGQRSREFVVLPFPSLPFPPSLSFFLPFLPSFLLFPSPARFLPLLPLLLLLFGRFPIPAQHPVVELSSFRVAQLTLCLPGHPICCEQQGFLKIHCNVKRYRTM